MTPASLSAAFTPRLLALASRLNRKRIVRRMTFPAHVEIHASGWALLRGQWRRFYGEMK